MALPNHDLSTGDLVLYEGALNKNHNFELPSAFAQVQYTDVSGTVKLQVAYRINSSFDWVVDDNASLTLDPALNSDYIRFHNPGFEEVQIKVVGSTGIINKFYFQN